MYRIPNDDRLADAIFVVMYRNQQVRSQSELARLVRTELEKDGMDYRVSQERIRKIALKRDMVGIHIDYNETDDTSLPENCPVCTASMIPIMNRTIYGENIEVGRRCSACPYNVGSKKRIPGRYTFNRQRR